MDYIGHYQVVFTAHEINLINSMHARNRDMLSVMTMGPCK